jgi:hypothetical protein
MHKSSAGNCSPIFLLAAFFILELAGVDGARAANVVNPSFELPVAGPPLNYIPTRRPRRALVGHFLINPLEVIAACNKAASHLAAPSRPMAIKRDGS